MNLYKKELITNHINLAYKISNNVYYKTFPMYRGIHTRKDINSVGFHALVRAAQKFKPELGFKFTTYAYPWIYWSCRKCMSRTPVFEELQYYDIPSYIEKENILYGLDETSQYILENYYGKHLTLKELASELGVSVNTVSNRRNKALKFLSDNNKNEPPRLESGYHSWERNVGQTNYCQCSPSRSDKRTKT